ncbi:MAG: hypothetical protein AABY15_09355 [Nanoarchaeota archaeon]
MTNNNYQIAFNYSLSTLLLKEASKEIFFELANRKLEFKAEQSKIVSGLGALSVSIVYNHVETDYLPLEESSRLIKALNTIVEGSLVSD